MSYCSDTALIMKKCVWHEMSEHFAENIDVLDALDHAKKTILYPLLALS